MTVAFRIYLVFLAAVFVALTGHLDWYLLATLSPEQFGGVVAFLTLGLLSVALAIEFVLGPNRRVSSSVLFVPLFACAIIFPPAAAVAVAGGATASAQIIHRVAFPKAFVNIAGSTLPLILGTWVLQLTAGEYWLHDSTISFAAFVAFALTAFMSNLLLVTGGIAAYQGRNFLTTLRQAVGASGGNLLFDIMASPIAFVMAVLYQTFYIPGLLLIILPLLLIRYSYLHKLQLQRALQDLLKVLIKTIETRDPYTSGHSMRVSTLARLIAEDMGLARRTCEQVETAALLHDIGKIESSYASIIRKPSDLTPEERAVIQTHATRGAEILRTLSLLDESVILGVRHHHERYDGTGYPDGLVGMQIPLAARIIMLCDSVDAMLSDRPYRRALGIDQVQEELLRCAGTQFDPDIVAAVLRRNTLQRATALIRPPEDGRQEEATAAAQFA